MPPRRRNGDGHYVRAPRVPLLPSPLPPPPLSPPPLRSPPFLPHFLPPTIRAIPGNRVVHATRGTRPPPFPRLPPTPSPSAARTLAGAAGIYTCLIPRRIDGNGLHSPRNKNGATCMPCSRAQAELYASWWKCGMLSLVFAFNRVKAGGYYLVKSLRQHETYARTHSEHTVNVDTSRCAREIWKLIRKAA